MSALFEADAFAKKHAEFVELRVLAGEQAGARVVLAPGEYLLGSGEDCSLVLRGVGIAGHHALLRFDGEVAEIEPLDGVIGNVQGDEISGAEAVALGVPFEFGGVWITMDHEDAPWPDIASDLRHSSATFAEKDAEAASSGSADTGAAPSDGADSSSGSDSEAASAKSAARRVAAIFICIIAVVLLALAGRVWWFGQEAPVQAQDNAPATTQQPRQAPDDLRRIVADFRQDGRLELKWSGKEWLVTGYVPDAGSKRMLLDQLAGTGMDNARAEVWVDAELLEAARRVLAEETVPGETSLKVDRVSLGVATLTGAVVSKARQEAVQDTLLRRVPGITSVETKALLPDALLQRLKERIAVSGLASRLAVISDAPEVKLSGRLLPEEIAKWENLFVEFNREYGDVLAIRATITRVIPKPPVGVQTIVGGAVPYIVTDSGQFVNQGGDVQGHTLTAIRDGEVVFEGSKRIRMAR